MPLPYKIIKIKQRTAIVLALKFPTNQNGDKTIIYQRLHTVNIK